MTRCNPLTYEEYMGHGHIWLRDISANAQELLSRVNALLYDLNWQDPVTITSGYRTKEHNIQVGGAPNSLHTTGRAVDLWDHDHRLYQAIEEREELLHKHGLWMEDGKSATTWVHLDIGTRIEREVRIFKP